VLYHKALLGAQATIKGERLGYVMLFQSGLNSNSLNMRKFLFSLMLLNLLNIATAQQDSLNQNQPVDTGEVFTIVQEMPILLSCDSLDATHDEKKELQ
jgi:hypothetical protein